MRPLPPLRKWVAQYVTIGTHEPIYRFDIIEARYQIDAMDACQMSRLPGEAVVSLVQYEEVTYPVQ